MSAPHPSFAGVGLDAKTPKIDILRFVTGGYWLDERHVLHGPGVTYKPLPEAATQPFISPRSAIMHSQAGPKKTSWDALWRFMFRSDVSHEPHIISNLDGTLVQVLPFNRRADCNAKANGWWRNGSLYGALSCETQDNGSSTLNTTIWPVEQITGLANLLTVQCAAYKIACTAPTKWDDTGIGYHSQFKEWSIYRGKTCPGAARIRQMDELRRMTAHRLAAYYENAGGSCSKV
jgi:hypothetical protein